MDDWQVGDLALCVGAFPTREQFWNPVCGGVYTVAEYGAGPEGGWLDLEEDIDKQPDFAWPSSHFRKIRPHLPDAEDAETIRLLNRAPATVTS